MEKFTYCSTTVSSECKEHQVFYEEHCIGSIKEILYGKLSTFTLLQYYGNSVPRKFPNIKKAKDFIEKNFTLHMNK